MSYSKITIKNIDNNLFSGSRDAFRTELGLFYYVDTDDSGHSKVVKNTPPETVAMGTVPLFLTYNGVPAEQVDGSNVISYLQTNEDLTTTASADVVVKTKRMFCRMIGDESKIESDLQWKTHLLGGAYADKTYNNIFETATFDDHSYNYDQPYNIVKAKELASDMDSIGSYASFENYEIGYEYNYHLPGYQSTINGMNNLMIPNIYMLSMVADSTDVEKEYSQNVVNFVTPKTHFQRLLWRLFSMMHLHCHRPTSWR